MGEVLVKCFEPGRANVVVTCAPVLEEVSFTYPAFLCGRLTNLCIGYC